MTFDKIKSQQASFKKINKKQAFIKLHRKPDRTSSPAHMGYTGLTIVTSVASVRTNKICTAACFSDFSNLNK